MKKLKPRGQRTCTRIELGSQVLNPGPSIPIFPMINKYYLCKEIKYVVCFVVVVYFGNAEKWMVGQRFSRNEVKENKGTR